MKLIDGKKIAAEIRGHITQKIKQIQGRKPGLAFILVGEHPASQSYVRAKNKACSETGIVSITVKLHASIAESDLIKEIQKLNRDTNIDGILVQLPLPSHINEKAVTAAISPEKDVDGFHPVNLGKMLLGDDSGFLPCTPLGILTLLEKSHIEPAGKHVVVVGRSNIVGKPIAAMLMQKKPHCNATVTVAHSQSNNLTALIKSADILIAAIGRPHFIKKEMIKPGIVIIDVGINRLENGKIVGDVDFENVRTLASHITPVPGGVGPMTIAMLLQNTVKARTHD
jgi:methylenetetrahydrofolate dehydrogenase (NADP+)/methenyltetrahydrofolate cyclohydrolase